MTVGVHVRCLPARDWYKIKAITKSKKMSQENTELRIANYTLTFSHHPPCWKHLGKFIALFSQSLATVTCIPTLSSTAAPCHSPPFSESSVKLQISYKTAHLRNSQKPGQLQDHSKSYTRATCILRKIEPGTSLETPPHTLKKGMAGHKQEIRSALAK